MDLKATIAGGYRNRLLLIALGTLAYAAWCLYDATTGYPNKQAIFEEYQTLQDTHPEDWKDLWFEKIEETGWPEQPGEITDWDITTQWLQFGIVFPIGAYCSFSLLMWSRRFIGADEQKLYSNGDVEVAFSDITAIDAARWESKGIAHIEYDGGSVLIDDWKYEREPADLIFKRLREHVDPEKISGLSDNAAEASDPDTADTEDTEPQEQDEPSTTSA